jgi:SpoVK/Ycf46/Vps4 family AAA+-type ATPase
VPNEAVLWAGPYLADLAYHLSSGGSVLIPSTGGAYLKLQGRPLNRLEIEVPWDDLRVMSAIGGEEKREEEASLRLKDVAGYKDIRERVEELIIWPEKHRRALRRPSRSSGILFFGPPAAGSPGLHELLQENWNRRFGS